MGSKLSHFREITIFLLLFKKKKFKQMSLNNNTRRIVYIFPLSLFESCGSAPKRIIFRCARCMCNIYSQELSLVHSPFA